MTVLAKPITRQGALILGKNLLNEAGLEKQVRIIVKQGEIRIVAMPASDPEALLAELAGCLGQEPASEYDFKIWPFATRCIARHFDAAFADYANRIG